MADNLKKLPKDKPLRKKASDYPVLSEEDFRTFTLILQESRSL